MVNCCWHFGHKVLSFALSIALLLHCWGEGLVRLIGAVVYLSCCAAALLVSYRGQWIAAFRAAVPLAHANQLPLPGL